METNELEILRGNPQLKKHVGTVHTAAALTLVQRKAFSALVFSAYPRLLRERTHQIPVDVLCELIGFDSKNVGALERALTELAQTVIRWEEGEGQNRKWAITTFLASALIEKGVCEYEFSEFLAQQLFRPEVYARINVGLLRDFQSRYGLALYENCARYRPNEGFPGKTPEWTLDQFRRLMGIADTALYSTFKELNRRIIKPSVEEVNKYSDIIIEAHFIKQGKNVVSVSFNVKENPQLKLDFHEDSMHHPLVMEVHERYRVPHLKAIEWLQTHGEARFREVLAMTNGLVEKGKAKSPVGFMRRAFEENYQPASDVEGEQKRIQAEKAASARARKSARRIEEERREAEVELERRYSAHLSETAMNRFLALPEADQQTHLEAVGATNIFFQERLRKQGREGVLGGAMKMLLTHHLSNVWKLRDEIPVEDWQQASGLRIEESSSGVQIIQRAADAS